MSRNENGSIIGIPLRSAVTISEPRKPDPILQKKSEAEKKGGVNLSIGEIMDENGEKYLPNAVNLAAQRAERLIGGYDTPDLETIWHGNKIFLRGVIDMTLGRELADELIDQTAAIATVGGTAAIYFTKELVAANAQNGVPKLVLGTPAYPNHPNVFKDDFRIITFPQIVGGRFNMEGALDTIDRVNGEESLVVLQGTQHNPTGINAKTGEWKILIDALKESDATVFLDLPYTGLHQGIDEDAYVARALTEAGVPTLIAVSFSKIGDLYRERTGALFTVAANKKEARAIGEELTGIERTVYSSPPDFGQRVMAEVFRDPTLYSLWEKENIDMGLEIKRRRLILADNLPEEVARQVSEGAGMYTVIPLSQKDQDRLEKEDKIFLVRIPGTDLVRVNIAGATTNQIRKAARAIGKIYQ